MIKKALLSLLISTLLVGGFASLAFTGLFNLIEARFYNPSVAASITADITRNAGAIDKLFTETQSRFFNTLSNPAVRRSFLVSQSAEDIFERTQIYGLLTESIPGIQWVRFVDLDGLRLHFSTFPSDIIRQNQFSVVYRNFNEPHLLMNMIPSRDKALFIFDEDENRIVFSFPFFDSFDVHRGTALFSLSVPSLLSLLAIERGLSATDITIVSNPPGFLSGVPVTARKAILPHVSFVWSERPLDPVRLASPESGHGWILLSVHSSSGFFFGRIVSDTLFGFNRNMEILFLVVFFATVYLTVFFLFNVRPSPAAIIQNRQKELQISLLEQFYERAESFSREGVLNWEQLSRELKQRRDEINAQLKQGVKLERGSTAKDIDAFIDRGWDELSAIVGDRTRQPIDEQKLAVVLERILTAVSTGTIPQAIDAPSSIKASTDKIAAINNNSNSNNGGDENGSDGMDTKTAATQTDEDIEELEELEELGELDEAEDVGELNELYDLDDKDTAPVGQLPLQDTAEEIKLDMVNVASRIEFTPITEVDVSFPPDTSFNWDTFDVTSPFSNNLNDTGGSEEELSMPTTMPEGTTSEAIPVEEIPLEELEEVDDLPLAPSGASTHVNFSLSSKPFSQTRLETLETLEAVKDRSSVTVMPTDIIEERSGIYYINEDTTHDLGEPDLNHDFKTLVDSVVSDTKGKL